MKSKMRILGKKRQALFSWLTIALVLTLVFLSPACSTGKKSEPLPKPPVAEKITKELTTHGQTRVDDYYWLKERDNPKVLEYLRAENDYLKAVMKHTEPLQEALFKEMVGRIKQTDMSVPYRSEGYHYYTRFEEGKEYPVYCRKKVNLEAPEEILLNVNNMAEGYACYHVAGYDISSNNNLLSYGVDTVSRRLYTIYFKDLTTAQILPDKIPKTIIKQRKKEKK